MSLIPIRCYTCNKVTGDKWVPYQKMLSEGVPIKDALDKLGLKRICCRRILMTHVDTFDQVMQYCEYKDNSTVARKDPRKAPKVIYLTGVIYDKKTPKPGTPYEKMQKRLEELAI